MNEQRKCYLETKPNNCHGFTLPSGFRRNPLSSPELVPFFWISFVFHIQKKVSFFAGVLIPALFKLVELSADFGSSGGCFLVHSF